ncbi:MAG: DUF1080 domain-containing protein [Bacteroidales bacterium]|nr:DUF1080 domain-containing protein [Bacteroidales bacterium]
MKKMIALILVVICLHSYGAQKEKKTDSGKKPPRGWVTLFDGKTLNNWKFSEQEGTFSVKDGMIVLNGKRSHLYYDGPLMNHNFKNFQLKADIMTEPGSNSGVYFHTEYQAVGFPEKGYEVQVNNSHTDWKRTGGLYDVQDLKEVPTKDNVWFTMEIIVRDMHIVIKLDGKTVVDYIEPPNANYKGHPGRKIATGTFALQGHDPKSIVYYKNIKVKVLP